MVVLWTAGAIVLVDDSFCNCNLTSAADPTTEGCGPGSEADLEEGREVGADVDRAFSVNPFDVS